MSDSISSAHSADAALGATAAHRPTLMGTRHMAVAGHYGAAHAAFAILEAGGNAVDAGVAAGLALGVLQCDIVNVAGVAPIILREAKTGQVHTIAGLGPWPRLADPEKFRRENGGHVPEGLLRTVVPAAPDAWITALERFGTMSFGEVAEAAIRFAEGFPMYPLLAGMIRLHEAEYRRWESNAAIYLPNGRPPEVGEIFRQKDLARTLRYMVDEEKAKGRLKGARDAFYRGDIARAITRYHETHGGWLRMEDMAEYRSEVARAVTRRWNGIEVSTCGPWCQGPVLLQALQLLDPTELQRLGHNSLDYLHVIAEALKLAFADRERWYGDPRFVDVPLERLLSESYAAERRRLIDPDRAFVEAPPVTALPPAPRDTSYVCVVDREGSVFSATPSDVSFESPVIPGTGLCPSSRGSQSWCDPAHKSVLAPGKRPRLTPSPALAVKPGEWVMPFGTPGGDVQLQAMLQVLLNIALFGMAPQEAVEAPRIATYSFPDSFEPHQSFPGRLNAETRLSPAILEGLASKGHDLVRWPDWTWRAGAVCTILAEERTGVLSGGADPRRPSYAVGW
ncbi:MAG: gamma-glutamyltransferase [Rhodospirillales bacterium]|nr:gamma-glutamyltransferase [Rhodospirillales bacterium]